MTGTARIIQSDARDLPLDDDSVDLVVTSPPYFGLRSYQDGGTHYQEQIGAEATPAEFVDALIAATREMVRVTKPTGSIWVNLGDKYNSAASGQNGTGKTGITGGRHDRMAGRGTSLDAYRPKSLLGVPWRYAIRCMDDLGLVLRAEVIWSKTNGMPESVTDRVRRSHEQWFHFTLNPRYYSNVDEVREESGPVKACGPGSFRGARALRERGTSDPTANNPSGKLPPSVWPIATEPLRVPDHLGVDHFAAFPMEFPRRIIRGWCPEDGVVLDPFGGTGTTATVAKALGRTGVHNDLSADYNRIAQWRTNDPAQLAKAAERKPPTVVEHVEGQAAFSIFKETTP